MLEPFSEFMARGGIAMWPLLLLSVASLTLLFERAWYFLRINRPGQRRQAEQLGQLLRQGQADRARALARSARPGLYSGFITDLLAAPAQSDISNQAAATQPPATEAAALEAIERHRRRVERFLPTLSTIITAAPMLGILGTVLGIIASFELLGPQPQATDPRQVSQGIAEALLTTAAGLAVAVVTLFPYNAFRTQVDRTLGRLEALAAAATGDVPARRDPANPPADDPASATTEHE